MIHLKVSSILLLFLIIKSLECYLDNFFRIFQTPLNQTGSGDSKTPPYISLPVNQEFNQRKEDPMKTMLWKFMNLTEDRKPSFSMEDQVTELKSGNENQGNENQWNENEWNENQGNEKGKVNFETILKESEIEEAKAHYNDVFAFESIE